MPARRRGIDGFTRDATNRLPDLLDGAACCLRALRHGLFNLLDRAADRLPDLRHGLLHRLSDLRHDLLDRAAARLLDATADRTGGLADRREQPSQDLGVS